MKRHYSATRKAMHTDEVMFVVNAASNQYLQIHLPVVIDRCLCPSHAVLVDVLYYYYIVSSSGWVFF